MRYNIYDNNLQYLENFILDITNSNYVEIGLRLLQWQYWWWFWMAFNWGILTAILNRLIRSKNSFFSTKIYTSLRPHAKFGDFVSTIIPLFWVTNILINSNYILRILEWQNDITLFTIRIIARQWYWVYKYELKNILDYYNLPKQIGLNKWVSFNFNTNIISLDYYYTFFLKNNNYININNYWNTIFENTKKEFFFNKYNNLNLKLNNNILDNNILNNNILNNNILNNNILNNNILNNNSYYDREIKQKNINFFYSRILLDSNTFFLKINKNNFSKNYLYKDILDTLSISIKQKRYTQNVYYNNFNISFLDNNFNKISKNINPYYIKNNIQTLNFLDYLIEYKLINKLKKYSDNSFLSSYISRRILRVRKSLVLPINININLITSSYDVVHSWFIPGLCIKIDCVPGKATHHTLNIDSQGFYYGQCAEICGRYHHHMPIRICALSFEHFLIWWNHFGLYRLYKPLNLKNLNKFTNIFIW